LLTYVLNIILQAKVTLPIKQQILEQSRKLERGQPMTIQNLASKDIESGLCLDGNLSSQEFWCLMIIYKFICTKYMRMLCSIEAYVW